MNNIKSCFIPAAGLGTRWAPFSNFFPKEMLPIQGQPIIGLVVQEAAEAGCKDIVIVINKKKEIIKKYLLSTTWPKEKINIRFVYQDKPLGIVDSISKARKLLNGKDFVLMFPDD